MIVSIPKALSNLLIAPPPALALVNFFPTHGNHYSVPHFFSFNNITFSQDISVFFILFLYMQSSDIVFPPPFLEKDVVACFLGFVWIPLSNKSILFVGLKLNIFSLY